MLNSSTSGKKDCVDLVIQVWSIVWCVYQGLESNRCHKPLWSSFYNKQDHTHDKP
jgi:hypothetical protein